MDIGRVIEIGEREVPQYQPAPTMVPVTPERTPTPIKEREREPEKVTQ